MRVLLFVVCFIWFFSWFLTQQRDQNMESKAVLNEEMDVHQVWCSNGHRGADFQLLFPKGVSQQELDEVTQEFCEMKLDEWRALNAK